MLDSKPEAPEAPDAAISETERESEIQGKEEDDEIQEANVEGDQPSAEAEGEPPISGITQEEMPSKLDVKDKQAVEQMEQIK